MCDIVTDSEVQYMRISSFQQQFISMVHHLSQINLQLATTCLYSRLEELSNKQVNESTGLPDNFVHMYKKYHYHSYMFKFYNIHCHALNSHPAMVVFIRPVSYADISLYIPPIPYNYNHNVLQHVFFF